MESLNENDFKNITNKIDFLQNMDITTRKLCPELQYFVSFSSVEFLYGANGYSVNSYANGLLQNIMKKRKNSNLCAVSSHQLTITKIRSKYIRKFFPSNPDINSMGQRRRFPSTNSLRKHKITGCSIATSQLLFTSTSCIFEES